MSDIKRDAHLSLCENYRYLLTRQWNDPNKGVPEHHGGVARAPVKQMVFVMLNPSTADAYSDDPTIRRCVGFGQRYDFDMIHVINLYAGRATKPNDLFVMDNPEGPDNLDMWNRVKFSNAMIVCAWGADKRAKKQAQNFLEFMQDRPLYCLGTTKDGSPKHPLYLKKDAPLVPFYNQFKTERDRRSLRVKKGNKVIYNDTI